AGDLAAQVRLNRPSGRRELPADLHFGVDLVDTLEHVGNGRGDVWIDTGGLSAEPGGQFRRFLPQVDFAGDGVAHQPQLRAARQLLGRDRYQQRRLVSEA